MQGLWSSISSIPIRGSARVRVKVPVHENDLSIPSVTALWKGANWLERETYDMFGINLRDTPIFAGFDARRF